MAPPEASPLPAMQGQLPNRDFLWRLVLGQDEYFNRVTGKTGTALDSFVLHTNLGRSVKAGGGGGNNSYSFSAPPGCCLRWLSGTAGVGGGITSMTFHWGRRPADRVLLPIAQLQQPTHRRGVTPRMFRCTVVGNGEELDADGNVIDPAERPLPLPEGVLASAMTPERTHCFYGIRHWRSARVSNFTLQWLFLKITGDPNAQLLEEVEGGANVTAAGGGVRAAMQWVRAGPSRPQVFTIEHGNHRDIRLWGRQFITAGFKFRVGQEDRWRLCCEQVELLRGMDHRFHPQDAAAAASIGVVTRWRATEIDA